MVVVFFRAIYRHRRSFLGALAGLLTVTAFQQNVTAQSVINWEAPASSANVSDIRAISGANEVLFAVSASGQPIAGINFESGTFDNLPNGMSFAPGDATASTASAGLTETTGDANYDAMLNRMMFANSGEPSGVIEFSGLTVGTEYDLQLWYSDQRGVGNGRTMIVGDDGASANEAELDADTRDFGENVVGSFTASATTQKFSMRTNGFANVHFNAIVLSTAIVINQDPITPIEVSNWIVDSEDEWAVAIDNDNSAFRLADGFATSNINESVFQSRVQTFTQKQTFQNMVIRQNIQWTGNKWGNPSEVDPDLYSDNDVGPAITGEGDRDAPVFLLIQDGDYWVFDRQASGSVYHAYHSTDMVTWQDKGIIGTGFNWVTTAEYHNGQIFIYTDLPNDHDPTLLTFPYVAGSGEVFADNGSQISGTVPSINNGSRIAATNHGVILDKPEVTIDGTTFSLAGGSDNCVFRDPSDGQFHIIHENWSRQNAEQFSFDSNIASHAISPDGITGFVFDEGVRPINVPGNLITEAEATDDDSFTQRNGNVQTIEIDGDLFHVGNHPNRQHLFRLTDQLQAWGDWTMIKVGEIYYLFADDDQEDGIGLGYWYGDSLEAEFTYGGRLRDGLHPDPGVGFGEGNFVMMLQSTDGDNVFGNDLLSHGPWVQGIEAQAGVDVDGDGQIDEWTDWQGVSESYSQIPGYSKAFDVQEAMLDTSSLPSGYGFSFRLRSALGNVVFDNVTVNSEPAFLLGDVNLDGFVNFLDISPFISLLSNGTFQIEGDINGDALVNFLDISPFIVLLSE